MRKHIKVALGHKVPPRPRNVQKQNETTVKTTANIIEELEKRKGKASICIIRRIGGIGDVVMALPTLYHIKSKYPDCRLTFAIEMGNVKSYIDLVAHIPYIDMVIDASMVDYRNYHAVNDISSVCIKHEHSNARPLNRIDIFALACGIDRLVQPKPILHLTPEELSRGQQYLAKRNPESLPVIVLHSASFEDKRSWPAHKYLDLVKAIEAEHVPVKIVLLDFNNVVVDLHTHPLVINASSTNVREMMSIIANADLLVGPDSGPMHLAGALGCPAIVLFGSIPPQVRINHYPTHEAIAAKGLDCLGCFVPGSLVLDGLGVPQPIESFGVGDTVLDMNGDIKEVIGAIRHNIYNLVKKVLVAGTNIPFHVTDNHEFICVANDLRITRKSNIDFSSLVRKPVKDIKRGDYLVLAPPKLHDQIPIDWNVVIRHHSTKRIDTPQYFDYDLAWLIGIFVAEGSASEYVVQFTTGPHEEDIRNKIRSILKVKFNLDCSIKQQEGNLAIDLRANSCLLARWLKKNCGVGAANKQLPMRYLSSEEIATGFLDGYLAGDGAYQACRVVAATASLTLAYQLRSLGLLLGNLGTLYLRKVDTNYKADRTFYRVEWSTSILQDLKLARSTLISSPSTGNHRWHYDGDLFFTPVKSIEATDYDGEVCNITVSDTHSYNIAGISTYNCWYKPCSVGVKCMKDIQVSEVLTRIKKRLSL